MTQYDNLLSVSVSLAVCLTLLPVCLPVHAALLHSLVRVFLRCSSVSAQTVRLHGETPGYRLTPLLRLPEHKVCEYDLTLILVTLMGFISASV